MTNLEIFVAFIKADDDKRTEIANSHPELFWYSLGYPNPKEELILEAIDNPCPTGEVLYQGYDLTTYKLPIMDVWNKTLVCLPDGEWVVAYPVGIWSETDNYIICWQNEQQPIAHLIRK